MSTRLRRLIITLATLTSLAVGTIQPALAAEPTLTGLTLAPGTATLTTDQTATFSLTGTYSDGSTATVTELATWQANGAGFTGIPGQKGTFTAVALGTWTVTATVGSLSASATITITPGVPVSLTLMPTPASVSADSSTPLRLNAIDADGNGWDVTPNATWTTNEPTGKIDATGYHPTTPGTWKVSATLGSLSTSRDFTVTAGAVHTLSIVPTIIPTVTVGKTIPIQVNAHDKDNNYLAPIFSWRVTNPNVGSISADGVFTAEGPGQTNIIVSADGVQEIIPVIVRAATPMTAENDPGIIAVENPNTTARTPRVAAEEVEVQPETTTQTPTPTPALTTDVQKNIPHPWVIVLIIAHVITLAAYFTWLMKKPTRWWWVVPIASTAILLAVYSGAFVEATYLWWPWTIIGLTIIFISVYYQRYGPSDGPPGNPAQPPSTPTT